MAYKTFDDFSGHNGGENTHLTLTIDGDMLELPDASYVRDADIMRDGMDLVLDGPDGSIIIQDYFAAEPAPNLIAPGGESLTPELVDSFAHGKAQYADAGSMNDASPVGAAQEVSGEATVTHLDGSVETIAKGTAIFQGDVIETSGDGAVNIVFADDTSFAVSEEARLAIDEYVYDPATQSGTSNFSVLKGLFVFTSGLIGRDDPDDVEIDTPVGSIGIRGTIIMGDVDTGEITVVEGAIVLRDLHGHEMTLAGQFETGQFNLVDSGIDHRGQKSAGDMSQKFVAVSTVAPELFSSLNDSDSESGDDSSSEDGLLLNEDNDPAGEEGEVIDEVIQNPDGVAPDANPFTGQHDGSLLDGIGSIDFRPGAHDGQGPDDGPDDHHNDPFHTGGTLDNNLPPPLAVNVQVFGVQENAGGGIIVARLVGIFSPNVTFELTGANAGTLYVLDNITATTADVKWIGGTIPDFESGTSLPGFSYSATNDSGAVTINDAVGVPILNVNEQSDVISVVETGIPAEYFAASEGSQWTLNLDELFSDPDFGDILSYNLTASSLTSFTAIPGSYITSANIDGAGNILSNYLTINFADIDFGADAGFMLQIEATDAGGLGSISNFNVMFNIYDQTTTGGGTITLSPGQTYNANSAIANLFVNNSINAHILTGAGDDSLTTSNSNNNDINTGADNDHVTVGVASNLNTITTGEGNDFLTIRNADNKVYGMQGNDLFELELNTTSVLSDLNSAGAGNSLLDGGYGGFDTLKFNNSGAGVAIDFTAIDDTLLRNFEKLDVANGESNIITLGYADIFAMTDDRGVLKINLDAGDTLNISKQGQTDTVDNSGADPVHFIGDVTLIIDGDATINVVA